MTNINKRSCGRREGRKGFKRSIPGYERGGIESGDSKQEPRQGDSRRVKDEGRKKWK